MNHTKLVGIIKNVVKEKLDEATHSTRYQKTLPRRKNYKTPQLAEEDDEENNNKGLTMTKQKPDILTVNPEFNSQISPNRGMPKPQIDSK